MLLANTALHKCSSIRIAPALLALAYLVLNSAPLYGDEFKRQLLQTWRARDGELSEAVFVVNMKMLTPQGSFNGNRGHDPASGDQPPEDTTTERRVTLSVSDKLRRLEFQEVTYNLSKQSWMPASGTLVVQEGGDVRKLIEYQHRERVERHGIITDRATELEEARMAPLLYFLRPLSIPLGEYSIIKLEATGAEGDAVELANSDRSHVLRLDPRRGYCVVHATMSADRNGKPGNRTDLTIEYAPDSTVGWVPQKWTASRRKEEKLVYRCEAEVQSYDLDVSLQDELFTLPFPPATRIFDLEKIERRGTCGKLSPGGS